MHVVGCLFFLSFLCLVCLLCAVCLFVRLVLRLPFRSSLLDPSTMGTGNRDTHMIVHHIQVLMVNFVTVVCPRLGS